MLVGIETASRLLAGETDLLLHLHGALTQLHVLGDVLGVRDILEIELMSKLVAGWHVVRPMSQVHGLGAANLVYELIKVMDLLGVRFYRVFQQLSLH